MLRNTCPDASASIIGMLVAGGPGPVIAALAKSATKNATRVLLARQRPPTLDGVPPYMDDFLAYLRANAGPRPTIVTAELSGASTHELFRALAVFLKNTPDVREAPLLLVVGTDEAGAEHVLVETSTGRAPRHEYRPSLPLRHASLPPLTERRIQRWLAGVDDAVASTLLLASGKADLEAALTWRRWVDRGYVKRRLSRWSFSSSGWIEAADQVEVAIETKVQQTARPVARGILHAAALFGLEFSRRAVVAAVSEQTGRPEQLVEAVFAQLCDLELFTAVGDGTVNARFRWPDPRFREHALRDQVLANGEVATKMALRVSDALAAVPSDARNHRQAAMGLSRLHGDRAALGRMSIAVEGGRDRRLEWSNLLSLHRLGPPSAALALELAGAALAACHIGYLRISGALAQSGAGWLQTLSAMDQRQRWKALGECGRAMSRSLETRRSGAELIRQVLKVDDEDRYLNGASRADLLHDLGCAEYSLDECELAIKHLEESKRLQGATAPTGTQHARLAITLFELGKAHATRALPGTDPRRMDGPIEYYRAARTMLLEAHRGRPYDEGLVRDAAQCLHSEALAANARGDSELVIRRLLQQGIDELASLTESSATPTIQYRLAGLFLEMRNSYLRTNDAGAAEESAVRGRAHARSAYETDPAALYEHMVKQFG